MKKDRKTGDLFMGFKSEPEQQPINENDVCRIFKGTILTEKEAAKESRKLMVQWGRSGEESVKNLRDRGVRGDVEPVNERVEWYKRVFAEDENKRQKKNDFLTVSSVLKDKP